MGDFVTSLFGGGGGNSALLAQQQQAATNQKVDLARQQQTLENQQAQQDVQLGRGVKQPVGRRLLLAATGDAGLAKTLG